VDQLKEFMEKEVARYVTPGIFGLAFLFLFLPFYRISAFGFSTSANTFNFAFGSDGYNFSIWALLLLLSILAGIGLSFWPDEKKIMALVGAAGASLLFLIATAAWISNQADGMGSLSAGFYLLFLLFLLAGAWNVFYLINKDSITPP